MTPAVLQALSSAAPAASSRQAAPAAAGDAPASFAAVLDGTVQALSGEAQADSGVQPLLTIEISEEGDADASFVPADPEVTALAGDQPRLDALALMLAVAPAPPGQAAPAAAAPAATAASAATAATAAAAGAAAPAAPAATAGAGAGATAAVSDALPVVAQARAAFDGTAAPLRPMPAGAPAAHPNDGHGARAAAAPPGSAEADAAADLVRAMVAAASGALRREGDAAPGQSRQVPASAPAGDANGTNTAGHPRPTAAAMASATTLSVVAGMQGASDAAPATIGKAVPLAASAAPPAPALQLSGEPGGDPASPFATDAPDVELVAAREVSLTPTGGALPALATTVAAAPGTAAHIAPPVGSPGWAPALAQQIVRLPGGGEVELHLNPAELGPLHVKLTLVESQAQVVFVAEHAAVRQALEAALPQLRTGLAESGINLGQATVGSGAGEQRTGQDGGERPARGERPPAGDERVPAKPHGPAVPSGRAGAVDTFA